MYSKYSVNNIKFTVVVEGKDNSGQGIKFRRTTEFIASDDNFKYCLTLAIKDFNSNCDVNVLSYYIYKILRNKKVNKIKKLIHEEPIPCGSSYPSGSIKIYANY